MTTYYWKTKPNFGDLLGPLLLKRFCNIDATWAFPDASEIVVVGSILEHLPREYVGVIAGCGKLHEKTVVDFPNATILGLRGPLTAKGVKGKYTLGDPGLLADELVLLEDKQYSLGIVPHWTDKDLEHNPIFKKFHPKIIRVTDDPLKVIKEIGQCRKIVSSSLHGIVIADAFNIPRRIEIPPRSLSHPHQEGGLFKWLDYSSSLNMKLKIGETQEADRNLVNDLQSELFDMFEQIKYIFS